MFVVFSRKIDISMKVEDIMAKVDDIMAKVEDIMAKVDDISGRSSNNSKVQPIQWGSTLYF